MVTYHGKRDGFHYLLANNLILTKCSNSSKKQMVLSQIQGQASCKGFVQYGGIELDETFAFVVKWRTIRTFISLATQKDWKLYHKRDDCFAQQ